LADIVENAQRVVITDTGERARTRPVSLAIRGLEHQLNGALLHVAYEMFGNAKAEFPTLDHTGASNQE